MCRKGEAGGQTVREDIENVPRRNIHARFTPESPAGRGCVPRAHSGVASSVSPPSLPIPDLALPPPRPASASLTRPTRKCSSGITGTRVFISGSAFRKHISVVAVDAPARLLPFFLCSHSTRCTAQTYYIFIEDVALISPEASAETAWIGHMIHGIYGIKKMNLSKLCEIVKDREAWCAAIHGATESGRTEQQQ